MKVYVVKILQARDESWKIFRIYKAKQVADEVSKALSTPHDYSSIVVLEYEVY